jgi:hypothetical protein
LARSGTSILLIAFEHALVDKSDRISDVTVAEEADMLPI